MVDRPIGALIALGFAYHFYRAVMKQDEGNETMRDIAQSVREGAMAYLKQQYKVVGIVFAVLCLIFIFMAFVLHAQNEVIPFAFLTGGFFLRALRFSRYENRHQRLRTHYECRDARA